MKNSTLTSGNYNVIFTVPFTVSRGLFTQVIETLPADSVRISKGIQV
jgi:hypothetical protein